MKSTPCYCTQCEYRPRWAPPDKTVYLHSAHVAEYRNYSADASHRWAEEHGEDINEPFAELTELMGDMT